MRPSLSNRLWSIHAARPVPAMDAQFDEQKHPRDRSGKFARVASDPAFKTHMKKHEEHASRVKDTAGRASIKGHSDRLAHAVKQHDAGSGAALKAMKPVDVRSVPKEHRAAHVALNNALHVAKAIASRGSGKSEPAKKPDYKAAPAYKTRAKAIDKGYRRNNAHDLVL